MNIVVKTVNTSFDTTITLLTQQLAEAKFGVLSTIPLSEKFKDKGLEFSGRLTILDVCNPMEAHKVIKIEPLAVNFLPCKFVVREVSGQVTVEMIRPTDLIALMNNAQLTIFASDIEKKLLDVLNHLQ
jgi:uncharacterized protein (DUF302 family)